MSVFTEYARYYDLLYRDKDYAGESDYIHGLITSHAPGARSILNLGCGSGRHDRYLVENGYSVTGVDLSGEMLAAAREASAGRPSLDYVQDDVRTVRLGRRFDVVVSLFHVMSYQVTNKDLASAFDTVQLHLNPGGLFLFDCWYGPGVLTDRPAERVKEMEDASIMMTRTAKPTMHSNYNVVDVDYHICIQDKQTKTIKELDELHRMRYLFLPEIHLLLDRVGMSMLDFHESFKPNSEPSFGTWSLTVVAQRPESSNHG